MLGRLELLRFVALRVLKLRVNLGSQITENSRLVPTYPLSAKKDTYLRSACLGNNNFILGWLGSPALASKSMQIRFWGLKVLGSLGIVVRQLQGNEYLAVHFSYNLASHHSYKPVISDATE